MKRCLITGAADGIGRALAFRLGAAGYEVVGVDRDEARAAATSEALEEAGIPCTFLRADLASSAAVDGALDVLAGRPAFDVVVHNAGISHVGRFGTSDLAAQQRVLAVNLRAPMVMTARLLEADKVLAGGSLVFLSSLSHQVSYPGAAVYAATKDALAAYARSLRVALAPRDIHVLRVFPGPVRTEHAARYSPPGSDASKRMAPDVLAAKIERALRARRAVLVPGGAAKVAAGLGRVTPGLMERVMKRVILDKLP